MNVSVRVGFDRGRVTRDIYGKGIAGGRGAASIWADFLIKATDGEPPRDFSIPPDIRFEKVDPITAQRPEPDCLSVTLVGRLMLKSKTRYFGTFYETINNYEKKSDP